MLPLAGAALLVAGEFSTLYEVRVAGSVPPGASSSAGAHHGYALAVVAAAVAVMAFGAVIGRSRPAAIALWLLAIAALGIALLADRPVTDDTGLYGRTYDAARAVAGPALRLELAGSAAILAGAALILFVPVSRRALRDPSRGRRPASSP